MTDEPKPSMDDMHNQAKALSAQMDNFDGIIKCINRRTFKGTKTEQLADWLRLCIGAHSHSADAYNAIKAKIKERG